MEKHHTRISKGTFAIPAADQKGTLITYEAAPNKYYQRVEIGGLKVESGSDGEVYWESSPQGARVLEGEDRAFKARNGHFNGQLYWRSLFRRAECFGIEQPDERPCFKVVMTPEVGSPQTCYYDADSCLPVRLDVVLKTPQGPVAATVRFDDYRKVADVLIPHKITQAMLGAEQIVVLESIEVNAEIPPERFALPEVVQALLAKSKATTEPAAAEPKKR